MKFIAGGAFYVQIFAKLFRILSILNVINTKPMYKWTFSWLNESYLLCQASFIVLQTNY